MNISMPTQEERLNTLESGFEQFKAETTTYYQEMTLHVTMARGLSEDAVKRLMQLRVQVDQRFNSVDQQLTEVKQDVVALKQDVVALKQDVVALKQDVVVLKQDVVVLKQDMTEVKQDIKGLRAEFSEHKTLLAQILERLPEKS